MPDNLLAQNGTDIPESSCSFYSIISHYGILCSDQAHRLRSPAMYPILGRLGPFFIYSYEVVLSLGIGACIGLGAWLSKRDGRQFSSLLNGFLFAIVLGIIGGRIVFIWTEWSYFSENPGDSWQAWRGGLNYHGLILTGLVALWAWSAWRKRPFKEFAVILAAILALMSIFGWSACWLEGCAYGRETAIGLLSGDLPDSFGVFGVRYQTQLMGLVTSAVTLALILVLSRKLRPLQLFMLALLALSLSRFVIGFYRGDEAPQIASLRTDVLVDGLLVITAASLLVFGTLSTLRSGRQDPLSASQQPED